MSYTYQAYQSPRSRMNDGLQEIPLAWYGLYDDPG